MQYYKKNNKCVEKTRKFELKMIQRLQTLFLLLYSLFGLLSNFFLPVEASHFSSWFSSHLSLLHKVPLLLGILSLGVVFCYKKRKLQIGMVRGIVVLHLLYWGIFIGGMYGGSSDSFSLYILHFVSSFVGIVALGLALKYIRKDEALIQSLDRLR